MTQIKDFILRQGLVVPTVATVNGVNVLANDHATYTTLVGFINTVQDNVAASGTASGYQSNDYATWLSALANDYSTYTTITDEYAANDYSTYTALTGALQANDYSTYTTITGEYAANDYSTYTALTGALQANDYATWLSALANDYSTYTTVTGEYAANDYSTYTALTGALQANDYATWLSALANDYSTYTTLANEYAANDYATYTTLLSAQQANDYATWSGITAYVNLKANSATTITAGDGLSGGGDLSTSRTISVDSTVVRTSGDQTIGGLKTFSDSVVVSGDLTVNGNVTTVASTNLEVTDRFIQLASNAEGTPSGDTGIYFNRGTQGNSAFYYDQAAGQFTVAETADPASNTVVSPTRLANLSVYHLSVADSSLVTNLNADLLDGQSGAYYVDFANATNTNLITLQSVTANGASTTASIDVGGLTVDTDTLYVDSTNNRVGVGTLTPQAALQVVSAGYQSSTLTTTATTANQVLDSFAATAFRTAKYLIQVHDTVNNWYHASELLLVHSGTDTFITEYAIVYSNSSLATFSADVSGGNIRLLVTPANADNVIRVERTSLLV